MRALTPADISDDTLDPDITRSLIDMLDQHNPFAKKFRMARDRLQDGQAKDFIVRIIGAKEGDPAQYSLPTTDQLAMLVVGDFSLDTFQRDIVIQTRSGELQQISSLHPAYMALQYPLLFSRNQPNPYLCYGLLSSQAKVDARAAIDESRLWYILDNQSDLRVENIQGISDAVDHGCVDGTQMGKMTILPSSFMGGRRYMIQNYHDAIAICMVHGLPDFFVTFTCNVKWPEIAEGIIEPGQKPSDRADIIVRVFNMKLEDQLHDIKSGKAFGPCSAVLHTVEFQKRGLPHAHIILWVSADTSQPTSAYVDSFVSAEIPDPKEDPLRYALVAEHMVGDEYAFFEKVWRLLADDIQYQFRDMIGNQNYQMPDNDIRNRLLDDLTALFAKSGSNIHNFNLPHRTSAFGSSSTNRLVEEELSYDVLCSSDQSNLLSSLIDEQIAAFNSIVHRVTNEEPGFFFVSGYGGTGKTFLWNCIVTHLRSQKKIVLTVASSGVAALLLPGGRTAHSRFKIPCDLDETSVHDIKRAFEALDRTFRDIQSQNCSEAAHLPFGGKVVVLGGDLRQILPVIEGGTPAQARQELSDFSHWILDVGDGRVNSFAKEGESEPAWIKIPHDLLLMPKEDNIRNENGPILHVDLILTDKEGGVMYAEIPRDEVQDKSPLIEAGKVYTISRFQDQHFPIDLPPSSPTQLQEDEQIVIEHSNQAFTAQSQLRLCQMTIHGGTNWPSLLQTTLQRVGSSALTLSAELQPVHTPASCGVADPAKSSTHVENKGAKRKLFDDQSTHKEDQTTFAQSAHQSSQQLNVDVQMTGHDKDTEEQHSEDPLDRRAKSLDKRRYLHRFDIRLITGAREGARDALEEEEHEEEDRIGNVDSSDSEDSDDDEGGKDAMPTPVDAMLVLVHAMPLPVPTEVLR
ncbi:uncharacterized protein [Miscanthus floridulus]|uniref:uncharacterized protein n=1 Tax=Miscanthus floridulus TaxID=154761 RepID=UPI003458225A